MFIFIFYVLSPFFYMYKYVFNLYQITYYGRRGKQNKPCGKIYDRYFNYRKIRQQASSATTSAAACSQQDNTSLNYSEDLEIDETLAHHMKAWLKYNDSPLEDILEKWEKTYYYRKRSLQASLEKKETISSFVTEWPLYKNGSLGSCLVNIY